VGIITETDLLREICRADTACSPEVTGALVDRFLARGDGRRAV